MTEILETTDGVVDVLALASRLSGGHIADNVEILNRLTPDDATAVLLLLPVEISAEILNKPELARGPEIVAALPRGTAVILFNEMSADVAADIVQQLAEPLRSDLMRELEPAARAEIESLLVYPENTAGAMMTTEFVSVPATWSVERTLQHIREVERTRETVYAIYVLDPFSAASSARCRCGG